PGPRGIAPAAIPFGNAWSRRAAHPAVAGLPGWPRPVSSLIRSRGLSGAKSAVLGPAVVGLRAKETEPGRGEGREWFACAAPLDIFPKTMVAPAVPQIHRLVHTAPPTDSVHLNRGTVQ